MSTGVIPMRVQVPYLTDGHISLIETVLGRHDTVLILLGVTSVIDADDPLPWEIRAEMIRDEFPEANIQIGVINNNASDREWSKGVDRYLDTFIEPVLYCGRDGFKSHYKGEYSVVELPAMKSDYTGTELRVMTGESPAAANTRSFRQGIVWAHENMRPVTNMTVDIAVMNGTRILLGHKPGIGYVFPGGFVDFEDQKLEDAAVRELMEETGIAKSASSLEYVTSNQVNDWRYRRRRRSRILTTLFMVPVLRSTELKMNEEFDSYSWFEIDTADNYISEVHLPLLNALKVKLYE